MRSLALKLIIAFLAVSLVGTALVALLAGRATASEFGQFVRNRDQELLVAELAEHYQERGSWSDVEQFVRGGPQGTMLGRGMPRRGMMALVDETGRVIVGGAGLRPGDQLPPAQVDRGIPVRVDDQQVGTLIVGPDPFRPNVLEGTFLARVYQALTLSAVGATSVALLLGIVLARALTRPLHELTAATRAVAQGEFGRQVEVPSQDELGELASAFNQMSADLARSRDLRRQMTADIAHDLRTPLSIILGHAEALRDGVLPPSSETYFLIHDEAKRLGRLVEDLRVLSLAEAGELTLARRPVSPQQLLERAAAARTAQAQQKSISLQVDLASDLPDVDVDPDRMAQVLNNLLENALRHTPEGGKIVLTADWCEEGVRLSVKDDGPGIAVEDVPHVFDRFYRADKSRQRHEGGSGLGLAIAKSIVSRHHGRIWVESESGQGATFYVALPASNGEDFADGRC